MIVVQDLRRLVRLPGFRRLFTVRLVSQCSDGMFQIGLATLFFFSPERASSAGQVAVAFGVLLAPFTIVGPWAGVFLDRWRRRQVLLVGNSLRAVVALVIVALMVTTPPDDELGVAVYLLALVNLSVNRFLLAALSAGLPRVVDGPQLLTANSLLPTLGAVAAGVGGGVGLALGLVLPAGRAQDAGAVTVAAVLMVVAAAAALRLGPDSLGPDDAASAPPFRRAVARLAVSLADGATYLARRGTPGQALVVMAVHRFLFGTTLVAAILVSRNLLADPADADAGLATFAAISAATALGFGLAVVLTPALSPYTGTHGWIVACLVLGAVAQALLAVDVSRWTMLVAGAALGLSSQGAKIAVDTIVQRDTSDAFLGRAFSLYDVLYNSALLGAAALAAVALPDTGASRALFLTLTVVYLATAGVYGLRGARAPRDVAAAR
ncbi:hypothetical protein ATL41_1659 [Flavimobilis soli]|uniref:MFS transporter n=1 Tax=Flavimobilis soli TaxID=442709 RepID=A0A2A9EE59_9MICO|nr:MFS transporter [Flavimobilis soli]PFG36916.1 hypothetical protein ATL41_1659 [Flavimobilis soli]